MPTSRTTLVVPQVGTINGLQIRYADSGGGRDQVVLLTSPWPESVYAFAPIWATLAEHAACLPSTYRGSARRSAVMT